MKRKSSLKRSGPPKKVNRKRMQKRKTEAYGGAERLEWVHGQECFVSLYYRVTVNLDDLRDAMECGGQIEAMHAAKSQGAGGTADDTVPCCSKHHHEFHQRGHITTAKKYGVNLAMAAELYATAWQLHELQQAA